MLINGGFLALASLKTRLARGTLNKTHGHMPTVGLLLAQEIAVQLEAGEFAVSGGGVRQTHVEYCSSEFAFELGRRYSLIHNPACRNVCYYHWECMVHQMRLYA